MDALKDVEKELFSFADKEKVAVFKRFFKTGKGQYGENDEFIGVNLPAQRKVARKFYDKLSFTEFEKLLRSPIHEHRHTALIMLTIKYKKSDDADRKKIVSFYLKNRKYINNWDLVDSSAPYILGKHLLNEPKDILTKLAKSKNLWDKRIAIVATWWFIRENKYDDALKLIKIVLNDKHDLIHKASGWMLREIGDRDINILENFLEKYADVMPRTMLRYAIEKLAPAKRKYYMLMKSKG